MRRLGIQGAVLFSVLMVAPMVWTPRAVSQSRVDRLLAEGDSVRERGDLREAARRYTSAVQEDRGNLRARLSLGAVRYEAGDWGGAEDQFRTALRLAPQNLEARYYQGMVKREQGRHRPPLTGWLLDEFKDARDHFEFVIAQDSSYRDVLYQYALLNQYRGDARAAVDLAYRQIRLKPADPVAMSGFFRMARMYASTHGRMRPDWLEPLPPDYRTLADAEAARREGELDEAQRLLLSLLQRVGDAPRVGVHLLLARIFATTAHPEAAEVQFWSAVDAIENSADAALVFEEVKYVLDDYEIGAYSALKEPRDYRVFFREIWSRRDPMPAASANARLLEHFRRLDLAEESYEHFRPRTFFTDPEVQTTLDFGLVYGLNHNFNDKGLIYIRHGPPNVRVFTSDERGAVGMALEQPSGSSGLGATTDPLPVESWRYYARGDQPEMTFHFATRAGGNWRMIAAPMWLQALNDRRDWGNVYAEAFQAISEGASLEIPRLHMRMQREAQESVDSGLQSDRHSWSSDVVALQLPAVVAAFRGPERSTQVEVFYAFPTQPIGAFHTSSEPVPVEVGLAVHDSAWTKVVNRRDSKRVRVSAVESDVAAGVIRFGIPPGSYTISMHVRPEETPLIGGWRSEYVFPDFSTGSLTMSDLLLASHVGPAESASPFVRRDLNVIPSFTGRYAPDQPVYVYYELYNLALDSGDRTRYTTEIELHPLQARRRGPFGLFGRDDRPVLTLRLEGTGTDVSPVEYAEVDMSDVKPGEYRLLVRVTDAVSGISAERSGRLQLVAP